MSDLIGDIIPQDLLGDDEDIGDLGISPKPRVRKPQNRPLSPERHKELLKRVLNAGAGLLQLTGEGLDYARAKTAKGINQLAFGDGQENVSGRDLLQKAGAVGPNDERWWWNQDSLGGAAKDFGGDLAGFATDVAIDPLTYATMGLSALKPAGKVLRRAGVLTEGADKYQTARALWSKADLPEKVRIGRTARESGVNLRDMLNDPSAVGGLAGLTAPFTGKTWIPPGSAAAGKMLNAVAEPAAKALEKIPGGPAALAAGRAVGRTAAFLFDPEVQGFIDPNQQKLARIAYRGRQSARSAAGMDYADIYTSAQDLAKEFDNYFPGFQGDKAQLLGRMSQLAAESGSHQGVAGRVGGQALGQLPQNVADFETKVGDFAKKLTGIESKWHQRLDATGVRVPTIQSTADFFYKSRQASEHLKDANLGDNILGLKSMPDNLKRRNPATKFFNANTVDEMLSDPNVIYQNVQNKTLRSASSISAYINNHANYYNEIQAAATAAGQHAGVVVSPQKIADDMASFIHSQGEKWIGSGKTFYTHDAGGTTAKYARQFAQATNNAESIHKFMQQMAVPIPPQGPLPPGYVQLADAFDAMGWDPAKAVAYAQKKFGPNAGNMAISEDGLKAIAGFWDKSTNPRWLTSIEKGMDHMNQIYKASLTLPFPGFHNRNQISGHWMNMASNEIQTPADIGRYVGSLRDFLKIAKNPAQNMGLFKEMIGLDVLGHHSGMADVRIAARDSAMPQGFKSAIPIVGPTVAQLASPFTHAKQAWKEMRGAGWNGVHSTLANIPKAAFMGGADIAQRIEASTRGTMYIYLRKKGWAPEAAAKRVAELQVDYSHLSPFEKAAMKRIVPFYSYMRRSVPEILTQVGRRPGGLTAQTIRAGVRGRNEDAYVPAYVGEGLSIPLGSGGYLSELGLPTDQLSDLFVKGPAPLGTLKRTGQKLASQVHPILKMPLEIVGGKNMFSGKDIEDMYQYPFDDPLSNQLAAATPVSRLTSSVRTLIDKRKTPLERAANVLTGVHITHPSGGMEREAQYAADKILKEMLREDPAIGATTDVYVKSGRTMRPESTELYRLRAGVKRDQRKYAKQRKVEQLKKLAAERSEKAGAGAL